MVERKHSPVLETVRNTHGLHSPGEINVGLIVNGGPTNLQQRVDGVYDIYQGLKRQKVTFEIAKTVAPGHAADITREMVNGGAHIILVDGGDGTANEAINAYGHMPSTVDTNVAFGLFPSGTRCIYARAVGTPIGDMQQAFDALFTGQIKDTDLLRMIGRSDKKDVFDRYCLINGGTGEPAAITELIEESGKRGEMQYLLRALGNGARIPSQSVTLSNVDTERQVKVRARDVEFTNGGVLFGGLFKVVNGQFDDGMIEAFAIKDLGLRRTQTVLTAVQTLARRVSERIPVPPGIVFESGRHLRVSARHGDKLKNIHADGEVIKSDNVTSIDVYNMHNLINMIVPQQGTRSPYR